jgi:hypothetical protein
VAVHATLAARLRVSRMPTVVYWKNASGRVTTDYIPRLIRGSDEALAFLASHWRTHIEYIKTAGGLTNFLTGNPGIPKVVQIVRRSAGTIEYQKLAAEYDGVAQFAILDSEKFPVHQYPISCHPSWVVYRHVLIPYRIETTLSGLRLDLENWSIPTMAELNLYNYPDICRDACVVRIGIAPEKVINDLEKVNMATFWMDNGAAARKLGAAVGSWVVVKPREMRFCKLSIGKRHEVADLVVQWGSLGPKSFKKLPKGFKMDWKPRLWLGQVWTVVCRLYACIDLVVLDAILVTALVGWQIHGYVNRRRKQKAAEAQKPAQEGDVAAQDEKVKTE